MSQNTVSPLQTWQLDTAAAADITANLGDRQLETDYPGVGPRRSAGRAAIWTASAGSGQFHQKGEMAAMKIKRFFHIALKHLSQFILFLNF